MTFRPTRSTIRPDGRNAYSVHSCAQRGMTTRLPHYKLRVVGLTVLLLVILLSACGNSSAPNAKSTFSPTSTTSTLPPQSGGHCPAPKATDPRFTDGAAELNGCWTFNAADKTVFRVSQAVLQSSGGGCTSGATCPVLDLYIINTSQSPEQLINYQVFGLRVVDLQPIEPSVVQPCPSEPQGGVECGLQIYDAQTAEGNLNEVTDTISPNQGAWVHFVSLYGIGYPTNASTNQFTLQYGYGQSYKDVDTFPIGNWP
jgi:hypothetical protein